MRTLAPPAKITFAGEPLNLHRRYIHPPAKTILPNKRKSLATTPTRCPIPLQSSALLPLLLRPATVGSPPSTELEWGRRRSLPGRLLPGFRRRRESLFSIYSCHGPSSARFGREGPPLPLASSVCRHHLLPAESRREEDRPPPLAPPAAADSLIRQI